MEIVGIIVALISLGIGFFALYWARKEEVVSPKRLQLSAVTMPKAFNTPGPIRTMLREMKLRLRARRSPKLDTPPAAKSILPRPVVVTPGRGDQEGQHLVADGDEVGLVLQGLELC
jgi:hypothetical protein